MLRLGEQDACQIPAQPGARKTAPELTGPMRDCSTRKRAIQWVCAGGGAGIGDHRTGVGYAPHRVRAGLGSWGGRRDIRSEAGLLLPTGRLPQGRRIGRCWVNRRPRGGRWLVNPAETGARAELRAGLARRSGGDRPRLRRETIAGGSEQPTLRCVHFAIYPLFCLRLHEFFRRRERAVVRAIHPQHAGGQVE